MNGDADNSPWALASRRLRRRDLLGKFGLGAAGALATMLPEGVASGQTGTRPSGATRAFPVTTMNHLTYRVRDYARTRDWYVDLFGMRIAWDNGSECALEFGSETSPEGMHIRPLEPTGQPTANHFGFGMRDIVHHLHFMKGQMDRWGLSNIRPDGELGWIASTPAGLSIDPWIPEKDPAMFPGAATPCKLADSQECRAAYAAGQKNLAALPKASGTGLAATSFSHVIIRVPQSKIEVEKEFYRDLLGMHVIYDRPDRVFLRYGKNAHFLLPTPGPTDSPYCNEFGFVIDGFDRARVEAVLKRRGLQPTPYSRLAWTVTDPDGLPIQIASWGIPEHLMNECGGAVDGCPR